MRKQILFIEPVLKPQQSKRKKKKQGKGKLAPLQIRDDAAGIDISPTEMFAAVGPDKDDQPVRRFGPFTEDLNRLADWLIKCKVKTVAMESTGVYWVALFQILEDRKLEVYLVNAHHLKSVPGRKSDVSDCQWIQQLHSLGLLKASFRPPQQVCALRSILRHRSNLTSRQRPGRPRGMQELAAAQVRFVGEYLGEQPVNRFSSCKSHSIR